MGHDYSYTQPSSSDDYDELYVSFLQAEVEGFTDEGESSYNIAEQVHYSSQVECDDGIPLTCYCGSEHVLETSKTSKDLGRRYFTCVNVNDGGCHVWKWFDLAVMEEFREIQRQLRLVKEQVFETQQKVVKLDKDVYEFSLKSGFPTAILMASLSLIIAMDEVQGIKATLCHPKSIMKDLDSPEPAWLNSQGSEDGGFTDRRRKWTPTEDKVLISAWLNTSKDPVVGNEQKVGAFWKRILDYFNSSPLLAGALPRELIQCKQRWSRINDQVCKFAGCYEAALREQRSGQNDDDVMKTALTIFSSDYSVKFTLEHAWRELRHDRKWCSTFGPEENVKDKRKQVVDVDVDEAESRPIGVKAAKAAIKRKKSGKEDELSKIGSLLEVKEKLYKQKLLQQLLAKKEPLSEMETSLRLKLISEMI